MTDRLPPGAVIGILGGGQLGRMLAIAAARLGYRTHIYEPAADPPAADVAAFCTTAPYDDLAALGRFAHSVDLVTFEFENVPVAALDAIEAVVPIRPARNALATSQDRLTEKEFLQGLGLATAPFAAFDGPEGLADALGRIGLPAILKTRQMGYDGKGQYRLADGAAAARLPGAAFAQPMIAEGHVDFSAEISVIAARGADGAIACFDPGRNVHRDGILATTMVPAGIAQALSTDAVLIAAKILTALNYVGVMGVELFVSRAGLVVNEIAPRVHNSGHWTQNGTTSDQFEQHIRAITGWPLGDGSRIADVVMTNLVGAEVEEVATLAADPANALHLYGKADIRPGRKMGHVNRVTPRTRSVSI